MAENKPSFILYCDLIHTVEKMPDDKAGQLLKHLLKYVNDQNPETDDLIIQLTFEPIKQQLKRDLRSWEDTIKEKSNGGKLGNLKRWHPDLYLQVINKEIDINEALIIATNRIPSHTDNNQSDTIASVAVNVTVNDNVIDNTMVDLEKKIINTPKQERLNLEIFSFNDFWKIYPNKVGKKEANKIWDKLSNEKKEKIKNTIDNYVKFKPFKEYHHPNPSTYLNQERWEDEIEKTDGKFKIIKRSLFGGSINEIFVTQVEYEELLKDQSLNIEKCQNM